MREETQIHTHLCHSEFNDIIAATVDMAERLLVNPACGVKTRQWAELIPALANMVQAATTLRAAA